MQGAGIGGIGAGLAPVKARRGANPKEAAVFAIDRLEPAGQIPVQSAADPLKALYKLPGSSGRMSSRSPAGALPARADAGCDNPRHASV